MSLINDVALEKSELIITPARTNERVRLIGLAFETKIAKKTARSPKQNEESVIER